MDSAFWTTCLAWTTFPFTLLLGLVSLYWLLLIIGAVGMEMLDFHVDVDAGLHHDVHLDPGLDGVDSHDSLISLGLVGIRWLNFGEVPLMIWVTAFALPAWVAAVSLDRHREVESFGELALSWFRNGGVGLISAKLLTQPLKGRLAHHEPNPVDELIGRRGTISSLEVTPLHGQMECIDPSGGPLKLHARTIEGTLSRGAAVEIVDYLPEAHTFLVREASGPT